MDLIIRNEYGQRLAVLENVKIAPVAGSSVTVAEGTFDLSEVHFDYTKNNINAYSDAWTISDEHAGTVNKWGILLEDHE